MEQLSRVNLEAFAQGVKTISYELTTDDWLVEEIINRGRLSMNALSCPPNPEMIVRGIQENTVIRFSIGQVVKAWRINADLSSEDMGLPKGHLSYVETDRIKSPTDSVLVQIADGLGINFLYLKLRIPPLGNPLWNNPLPIQPALDNDIKYPVNFDQVLDSMHALKYVRHPLALVIRKWRNYRNLRLSDLDVYRPDTTPWPKGYISQIENGKINSPALETLIALANGLEIPYSHLLLGILPHESAGLQDVQNLRKGRGRRAQG